MASNVNRDGMGTAKRLNCDDVRARVVYSWCHVGKIKNQTKTSIIRKIPTILTHAHQWFIIMVALAKGRRGHPQKCTGGGGALLSPFSSGGGSLERGWRQSSTAEGILNFFFSILLPLHLTLRVVLVRDTEIWQPSTNIKIILP